MVFKLSHGAPDLNVLRSILPKHLGTKGNCLIDLLAPRQILLRFDQYEDYVQALSRSKSLLSIASAVGKPIAIDKATQIKSRPSTARVKVILDLMEKLPNCIRLQNQNNKQIDDTIEGALKGTTDSEKYQGDAREILNEKRKTVDVDQSKATSSDRQLVASTSEQNRVDSIDVGTSNIGIQTTIENKGDCNNQQPATNEVQSKEVELNLMSNATKNAWGIPRVGVDAPRVDSGQKLIDSRQKLMDTSDVEDAENSGQHVLQVANENPTKNWTLVTHKKSTSSQIISPASQNNSPCSEKVRLEIFMIVRRGKILVMPHETYYVRIALMLY
ncbi:hypothetical protein R3W88_000503 [Solanum pinnatisectum]|uniref:Uncharacterized protein n=1 Tax=Solanum pinnatisectum TaxID=50273 RepID=A0AAV9MFV6_9SOLN|nr:hypothetical protein R3W88_000503 [Solanum pinnatisectum]